MTIFYLYPGSGMGNCFWADARTERKTLSCYDDEWDFKLHFEILLFICFECLLCRGIWRWIYAFCYIMLCCIRFCSFTRSHVLFHFYTFFQVYIFNLYEIMLSETFACATFASKKAAHKPPTAHWFKQIVHM